MLNGGDSADVILCQSVVVTGKHIYNCGENVGTLVRIRTTRRCMYTKHGGQMQCMTADVANETRPYIGNHNRMRCCVWKGRWMLEVGLRRGSGFGWRQSCETCVLELKISHAVCHHISFWC